ncbi:MAG: C40 family peptidase [Saprospiraceae bacterium]|jgi:cell wall-associated NlpC family hydrolase|nr:C40 family peptidase [Candidatus Brachybacter algidus]MBP9125966.1 C40 family peptidase [Saprospiraceae bacterium]MBK8354805.1 C40 family peptidase [Candidatus Brachybacter algidus]MBK8603107.1 C40 family peptidase [Candidatus Brachybacter algidus]MBK8843629.1 C40 family peptidase [Candidatus Brachybacter algidus]
MKSILLKSIVVLFLIASFPSLSEARNYSQQSTIPPFLLNTLSIMFNMSAKVKLRANIIDYASKYIGTPYRSGGVKPGGFDCSGFVRYVYAEYGFNLEHSSRGLSSKGESVKREDAKPGDLVFFAAGGRVHHVGIVYSNYNSDLKIIHSCNSKGVSIDSVNSSSYWSSRLYSIRRVL